MNKKGKTPYKSSRKGLMIEENCEKDNENIKKSLEEVIKLIKGIINDQTSPYLYTDKNILYQSFLNEIDKIKDIIVKILSKESSQKENQVCQKVKEKQTIQQESYNIKIFQEPTNNYYEKYGIKLKNIESKYTLIREKIIENSLKLEDDEKNITKRNKYLENIANLSRNAHEYSYQLIEILLKEFNKKNKFKTIIYEKAKTELSSWVNQSLAGNDFFKHKCPAQIKLIKFIKNINDKSILEYYINLYIDLCELFTKALLYSEINIELIYFIEGKDYQQNEMKDITELNGSRKVKFTVLPGFFVNKKAFEFAKALVFCEYESNSKLQFNISKIPNNYELVLNETIKIDDLINKITIDFDIIKVKNDFKFSIKTQPNIPEEDNPLFLMRFYEQSDWKYVYKTKDTIFSFNQSNFNKNQILSIDILIYGKIIYCKYNKILK